MLTVLCKLSYPPAAPIKLQQVIITTFRRHIYGFSLYIGYHNALCKLVGWYTVGYIKLIICDFCVSFCYFCLN